MTDNVISIEDILRRRGGSPLDPVLVKDTIDLVRSFMEIDAEDRRRKIIDLCRQTAAMPDDT